MLETTTVTDEKKDECRYNGHWEGAAGSVKMFEKESIGLVTEHLEGFRGVEWSPAEGLHFYESGHWHPLAGRVLHIDEFRFFLIRCK